MFADDTTLLLSSKSLSLLQTTINSELLKVSEWLKANQLSLNVEKTNYMIFKKKTANSIHIHIDKVAINRVSSNKFLGVLIDEELNWKEHIASVATKIGRIIGILFRIRYKISYKTTMLLYNSLILSQINYCNIIWASNYINISK